MVKVLTIGEPMGLLVADEVKPLDEVEHFSRLVCGAEVNFSVGISRLLHQISYITKIGNDPFGKHIKKFLKNNGIDDKYVIFDEVNKTGMQLKAKVLTGDPEVVNFRKNSAFSTITPDVLKDINFDGVKHLHITGIPIALNENSKNTVLELVKIAKSNKIQVSFDPNLRPALWQDKETMVKTINEFAALADIILPGISEGNILTGFDTLEGIADFYLKLGAKIVIIKDGAKGSYAKTNSESLFVKSFKVEKVVDTVGAGDGFAVGVVSALLEGLNLKDALIRGNAIGALAVMSVGDNEGLPTIQELDVFIKSQTI